MTPNDCTELHKIADALALLVGTILTIGWVILVLWIVQPSSHSTGTSVPSYTSTSDNEGYGHSFVWRGYEAQEAYRKKHWGSYQK